MAAKPTRPYGLSIPRKGITWVYDFWVDGQRHTRSTRERDYRAAVKVAAAAYAEAVEGRKTTKQPRKNRISLREAFGRFYNEKAAFEANHKTVLAQLARLARELGPDLFLDQLTTDDLLKYQTDRRKSVSNRTVNAEVPELLRRVIKRAKMWGVDQGDLGASDYDWSSLKLELPAHRTRSASREEQARLLWSLRKDYRPIIIFALRTGLRKKALLVERDQIDWDTHTLRYRKKSKRTNDIGLLPLTPRIERLLRHEISKAPNQTAVFTYEDQREGGRKPITAAGLQTMMRRAVAKAGLKDWRLIHDLRHTAATETLRSSQNLAAVQVMLGHSDIAQTSRYAHVLMADVREAMQSRENSRERRKT